MRIFINDQPHDVATDETLASVVGKLGVVDSTTDCMVGGRGVAIAINGEVVPRATWSTRVLVEADRVLVIRATQGG